MKRLKKLLFAIVIVLIAIQFIQPARNVSGQMLPTDIIKAYNLPANVEIIFKNACYDCHSNNTHYPWYMNIQPMGWLMAHHIKDGKEKLNFSEFGSYSRRKQRSKLREIESSIHDESMPLSSYTLMHKDAKLTKDDRMILIGWARKTKDSLAAKE